MNLTLWLAFVLGLSVLVGAILFMGSRNKKPAKASKDKISAGVGNEGTKLVKRARALQEAYWTADPAEKARLLSKGVDALAWGEMLRLLHLACLEMLSEGTGKQQLQTADAEPAEAPKGALRDLIEGLLKKLQSPESPYRSRPVAVWNGQPGESEKREPDIQGDFRNASLTHLGCIEIIRLDKDGQPNSLAFVSLDEIRGAFFLNRGVFRCAKLFFEDGRPDEIVLVPLLYGLSWNTPNGFDRDGTFTRFICFFLPDTSGGLSIGVGHQDFVATEKKAALFGLGSVGEIMVMLAADDPKFDMKCRARGLDPETVRKSLKDQ